MIDITKLKELEAKATGGPWESFCHVDEIVAGPMGNMHIAYTEENVNADDDAKLIAESRNQLPEIIAWIERAKPLLELMDTGSDYATLQLMQPAMMDEAAKLLGEIE